MIKNKNNYISLADLNIILNKFKSEAQDKRSTRMVDYHDQTSETLERLHSAIKRKAKGKSADDPVKSIKNVLRLRKIKGVKVEVNQKTGRQIIVHWKDQDHISLKDFKEIIKSIGYNKVFSFAYLS